MSKDMLERGSRFLARQEKRFSRRSVVYVRGSEKEVIREVSVGTSEFEVDTGDGVIERLESRDYLIDVSELKLSGKRVEPQRGDRIRERVGDLIEVYEVLPMPGESHFRFHDTYQTRFRIHTKHVETLEA